MSMTPWLFHHSPGGFRLLLPKKVNGAFILGYNRAFIQGALHAIHSPIHTWIAAEAMQGSNQHKIQFQLLPLNKNMTQQGLNE